MRGDRCRVRVVVADAGVDDAAVGGGSTAAVGCGGGTLAAEATSRLFTTVFTPSTCAASVAAAERAASLLTVPDRVTTPLLELIVICLSGTLLSAKILFCTSDAICESERLPILLQPMTASARESSANPRYLLVFFIFAPVLVACFNFRCRAAGFNCEFCKLLVIQYLTPFSAWDSLTAPHYIKPSGNLTGCSKNSYYPALIERYFLSVLRNPTGVMPKVCTIGPISQVDPSFSILSCPTVTGGRGSTV